MWAFDDFVTQAALPCSLLVQAALSASLRLPSEQATILIEGLARNATQPAQSGIGHAKVDNLTCVRIFAKPHQVRYRQLNAACSVFLLSSTALEIRLSEEVYVLQGADLLLCLSMS